MQRRRIQRLLVAALRDGPAASLPAGREPIQRFAELASFHRLSAWLWLGWRHRPELPPELAESLEREWSIAAAQHLRIGSVLGEVGDALSNHRWLVVKGPALAVLAYPRPDQRSYSDLDVLVAETEVGACVDKLMAAGFWTDGRDLASALADRVGQLSMQSPGGIALDLHWQLIKDQQMRDRFTVPTTAVMERARSATVGNAQIRTTSETDTLLHVAVHACLAGVQRLGWANDIHRLLESTATDWPEVVGRAREWGVERPVGAMLGRNHRMLGSPVPEDVLSALDPGAGWRRMERLLDVTSSAPSGLRQRAVSRTHNRAAIGGTAFAVAESLSIAASKVGPGRAEVQD